MKWWRNGGFVATVCPFKRRKIRYARRLSQFLDSYRSPIFQPIFRFSIPIRDTSVSINFINTFRENERHVWMGGGGGRRRKILNFNKLFSSSKVPKFYLFFFSSYFRRNDETREERRKIVRIRILWKSTFRRKSFSEISEDVVGLKVEGRWSKIGCFSPSWKSTKRPNRLVHCPV